MKSGSEDKETNGAEESEKREVQTEDTQGYCQALPPYGNRQVGAHEGREEPPSASYLKAIQAALRQDDTS